MQAATIHTLASAVVSAASGSKGRVSVLYVGWTEAGLPAATSSSAELGEPARAALRAYRASGLPVRKVAFREVAPVKYLLTGTAVDFADVGGRTAEDQVRYSVVDAAGEKRSVALGELSLLSGIALARHPWQSLGSRGLELAVSAVPLYTVFAGLPGEEDRKGVAMLFDSTLAGRSNEPAFRSFVRNSIGRLLLLDESQPSGRRRGYLDAAGEIASVPPVGGLSGTLINLRRLGFVEFDDGWLRQQRMRGRRLKGLLLRGLQAAGMVEIDELTLSELTDPRPDYDVDRLDTERLIDLAEAMLRSAGSALRGADAGARGRRA